MKSKNYSLFKMIAVALAFIMLLGVMSGLFTACDYNPATMSRSELELCVSDTYDLTVTDVGEDEDIAWSTSNGAVASVTQLGCVTAKKAGTATITAVAGGRKATCKVTVGEREITLSASEKTVYEGESAALAATVKEFGKTVSDPEIVWSSDNADVATVSAEGLVTGVAQGTAKITAKVNNTKAECSVTVREKPVALVKVDDPEGMTETGVWGYYTDAADGEYTLSAASGYSEGTVTFAFSKMTDGKDYTLLYLPDVPEGQSYTFSCKLTLTAASTAENTKLWIVSGDELTPVALEANKAVDYVFDGAIAGGKSVGFRLAYDESAESGEYALTVGSFAVQDVNGYQLEKVSDHNTPTAAQTWNYWLKGDESAYDITEKSYNYGTLTFKATAIGSELRLIYLPQIEAGKTYKLSFDVTVNKECTTSEGNKYVQFMNYGSNGAGAEWMTVEKNVTTQKTYEIAYPDGATVKPLKFVVQPCSDFEITVSNFVIVETQPAPPADAYDLERADDQNNPAEAGKWFYYTNADEGEYEIAEASHANGKVTFSFTKMQGGKQYRLIYQPDLEAGEQFVMKAAITLNKNCNASDDKKVQVLNASAGGDTAWLTLTADEETTFTFTGTVQAGKPVKFDFNPYISASETNIFTFEIEAEVSEKTEVEPDPDEPSSSYSLQKIDNEKEPPAAGVWYYYTNASSGVAEAKYENGTVTVTFDKLESGKNYTIVYLPEGSGDYTLTCDISSNRAGKWVQFKNATFPWIPDFTADVPQQFTYDVAASNRLLRFTLNTSSTITADNKLVITISNVVCTPAA